MDSIAHLPLSLFAGASKERRPRAQYTLVNFEPFMSADDNQIRVGPTLVDAADGLASTMGFILARFTSVMPAPYLSCRFASQKR